MVFALILVLVVVVEALIEYFGSPIPSAYKPYVAAVLGVLLCLAYGADLLALLGYPASVPYVGSVLTGLLISRGSNVFNDLVSRLNVIHTPAAPVDQVEP
jgi:hypothetical protein